MKFKPKIKIIEQKEGFFWIAIVNGQWIDSGETYTYSRAVEKAKTALEKFTRKLFKNPGHRHRKTKWFVVVSKKGRYLVPATAKSKRIARKQGYALIGPFNSQMEAWAKGGYAPNPGRRHLHTAQWRRMVKAVKRRGGAYSPYAVATARLGPSRLKNPPCEYCRLLHMHMLKAKDRKESRRARARLKLHLKQEHKTVKNPFSSKTKQRALRVASKLAYRIWHHVKEKGYAIPFPKRTPVIVKKYTQEILRANGVNWTIKNPPDKTAARELELYIENDSALYHAQYLPIVKNLQRKIEKGIFRKHLSAKLFLYLVDNGAKKYVREFGGPHDAWNIMFPKRTRLRTARSMAHHFLMEYRAGNRW